MNKTTLGIATAGIGLAAGLVVCLPCFLEPRYGIILRATNTDIDSQKWTGIEGVLKAASLTPHADSRDKLYRIREFDNGNLVPIPLGGLPEGTLDKMALLEDYDATISNLKTNSFTGHAFQIGVGAMERSKRIPKSGLNMPQAHYRQNILESKEMVKKVDDVLNGP